MSNSSHARNAQSNDAAKEEEEKMPKKEKHFLRRVRTTMIQSNDEGSAHTSQEYGYKVEIINGHPHLSYISKQGVEHLYGHFNTQANDVFFTSYPKCGTHWLMKIVLEIVKASNNHRKHPKQLPWGQQNTDYRFIAHL